jgi:nucleotide-binding universal stress UspA family protein/hemerythrin-like domain-containing protein
MYRHLLVPIDGSDLSIETVGRAAEFARSLGARITFFHAQPDHAATLLGEADVVRLTSPEEFEYAFEGRTREILAKAESAARAMGVPCDSRSAVSNSPHEAIVAAARAAGCDLIFMASRGRRIFNTMIGSQTLKVLAHAGMPVHVCATSPPAVAARAIGIIRDEHRSLGAVLHAWMHLMSKARRTGGAPDARLMRSMVRYLREFPVALHHPKEDEYLFDRLRQRTGEVDAELDELERQHERDRVWVGELEALVERVAADGTAAAGLEQSLGRYATFIWEHLGREEGVILPAAERHLTLEDWTALATAFAANGDPRFAESDAEYRQLFSRIVNRAGAPGS